MSDHLGALGLDPARVSPNLIQHGLNPLYRDILLGVDPSEVILQNPKERRPHSPSRTQVRNNSLSQDS
jgi:hypothetical protein